LVYCPPRYRNLDLMSHASMAAERTIIKEANVSEDWVHKRSGWAMRLSFPVEIMSLFRARISLPSRRM